MRKISRKEFTAEITSALSTMLGTSHELFEPAFLCPHAEQVMQNPIREYRAAFARTRDIVFTGNTHLLIENKKFFRHDVDHYTILACGNDSIYCYYLIERKK